MKRSRLSRKGSSMKKDRMKTVESAMNNGGVVGIIKKGVSELERVGEKLPKAAKEITGSGFLYELTHLEKKSQPLTPREAQHVRELLASGASMKDVAKEFGYRPDTMQELLEESDLQNGEVRGFF